jgi:hypothetical protein
VSDFHKVKWFSEFEADISFSDNNEWGLFELQYGMQLVNRTNGEFTRRYKRSMFDYVDFFHQYVESESK